MSRVIGSFSAFVFGYLCGSIPFGIILTRLAGTKDLRAIGSGNIGATNVLRTGRKDLAALTLLLDALKGTFAVLVANGLWPVSQTEIPVALCAAAGAFLGHLFPVWLRFKGGKGVATFLGCLFGLQWQAGLAFVAIWLGVAALTRYSSAAALSASALVPVVLLGLGQGQKALLFTGLAVLLWIMHRANIMRLLGGTEHKIGQA
ncbi:glycerol-3-phosphate 1-O-acyltransferase PlsY [Methyloferula stellata]|uniref:glycerol-3-phosphate 1-O-acyltransferase PlsY n=1 Tax=Methyloferula stellata TaxID=876270 RepID=UPI0003689820|nr:glycerol-3-phosphate 1-O-acyltransferase PlsY [Methyloferula stellata]